MLQHACKRYKYLPENKKQKLAEFKKENITKWKKTCHYN